MQSGEHVHIISAGANIHTAYAAIFRTLPSITRTCVLIDSTNMEFSPVPEIQKQRTAVRNATATVKEISASLSIPFTSTIVHSPVYPSVRTILLQIRLGNPRARYTFDLSGGSPALCVALSSLAPWLGGEVYSAFDGKVPGIVPGADPAVKTLMENPNYQTILAVLLRNNRPVNGAVALPSISRTYLFTQVWQYYHRSRTMKIQTDPAIPVPRYRKGRTAGQNMTQQTFSGFMQKLCRHGLVEEMQDTKNRKEKFYRVTDCGETAFRFSSDPAANSLVRMILEGS